MLAVGKREVLCIGNFQAWSNGHLNTYHPTAKFMQHPTAREGQRCINIDIAEINFRQKKSVFAGAVSYEKDVLTDIVSRHLKKSLLKPVLPENDAHKVPFFNGSQHLEIRFYCKNDVIMFDSSVANYTFLRCFYPTWQNGG